MTNGSKGAVLFNNDNFKTFSSFPNDNILDSTGAGDMFAAGFLFKLNQGKSLEESVTFGCNVASKILSQYGARPSKEMFKEFSIRNKEHPQYFYKSSFLNQLESTTTTQPQRKSSPVTTIFDDESGSKDITKIRTKEQLEHYLDLFLDSIQPSEYILRELELLYLKFFL